ncbi:hypothetical protein ECANGB1_1061 [Enterospora canceri]|uniref:Uncharacterized protein n=1 Tax=Enterospora canceri TaxID=1081671 RepID=A0A1Y1S6U4_9MICR|nr:hypothetical protein ECANGB1_1061 [Enterospora canceri]
MAELNYTENDLKDMLDQTMKCKEAPIVFVFEPNGACVSNYKDMSLFDGSIFTKYINNAAGCEPMNFLGNSFVFVQEHEEEKGAVENKMWLFVSREKLDFKEFQDAKVGLCLMYHEAGVFIAALCSEMHLRLIVPNLYNHCVANLDKEEVEAQ